MATRNKKGQFIKVEPRIAQQNVGDVFQVPNREPTPELKPNAVLGVSGQPGEYDVIIAGHPKAALHMDQLRSALGAASYSWIAVKNETLLEGQFREDLQSLLESAYIDSYNDVQGWPWIAESFLQYWSHGSYVAEIRDVEAPAACPRNFASLNNIELEMYPVHPSTIQQYIQSDNYRKLDAIRQSVTTGTVVIPAEKLIVVPRGGVIGQYTGESLLRPLVFPFQRWRTIWLSNEQTAYMQGGLLVFEAPEDGAPGGDADWRRVQRSAAKWASNEARFLIKPGGWKHELHTATASVNGDEIDRIDAYFDFVLGDTVAAVISSSTGHRALGEVAAEVDAVKQMDKLSAFLRRVGNAMARYVAKLAGYSGRLPTLSITPREVNSASADQVTPVLAAVSAGAVDMTPELKVWVAQRLGIPEPAPDQVEAVPTGELPDPLVVTGELETDTPDLFAIPPEAQEAAAEALLVRRQSSPEFRGLEQAIDLRIARKIASGTPLTAYETSILKAWFKRAGDPTLEPDYESEGPSWQNWNGRGGTAMSEALLNASVEVDGVPNDVHPESGTPEEIEEEDLESTEED